MRPIHLAIATGLVLALSCHSAIAQWKWRDAGGRVTASDMAPPNIVPERDILARPTELRHVASTPKPAIATPSTPSTAGPAVRLASADTDPELEARRKRTAEEQKQQQRLAQAGNEAVRSENCGRARGHLAALADGQRMTRTNAQGEREVLDDKARADEMQRARSVIASDCK